MHHHFPLPMLIPQKRESVTTSWQMEEPIPTTPHRWDYAFLHSWLLGLTWVKTKPTWFLINCQLLCNSHIPTSNTSNPYDLWVHLTDVNTFWCAAITNSATRREDSSVWGVKTHHKFQGWASKGAATWLNQQQPILLWCDPAHCLID